MDDGRLREAGANLCSAEGAKTERKLSDERVLNPSMYARAVWRSFEDMAAGIYWVEMKKR
jgi:hypothetical protein